MLPSQRDRAEIKPQKCSAVDADSSEPTIDCVPVAISLFHPKDAAGSNSRDVAAAFGAPAVRYRLTCDRLRYRRRRRIFRSCSPATYRTGTLSYHPLSGIKSRTGIGTYHAIKVRLETRTSFWIYHQFLNISRYSATYGSVRDLDFGYGTETLPLQ